MNIFCAFSTVFFNHFNNFYLPGDTIPSGSAKTVSHNPPCPLYGNVCITARTGSLLI